MPSTRPCLLVDLDDTLLERTTAFAAWAGTFVAELGGSAEDHAWLVEMDDAGYRPREELAELVRTRFGIADAAGDLVQRLRIEHLATLVLAEDLAQRLGAWRSTGGRVVVVSNGTVDQQTRKLRITGLGDLVDAVVISEAVGVKKPDPRIFAHALDAVGAAPEHAWMVGDHPVADVAGGQDAGLKTGWVSRGRTWPGGPEPTLTATTTAEVLDAVVAVTRGSRRRQTP